MEMTVLQKANAVIDNLNSDISDFVEAIKEKASKQKANAIPKEVQKYADKSAFFNPCPTTDNVPDMSDEQREQVRGIIETMKQEVDGEPYKFKDMQEDDRTEVGIGSKDYGGEDKVMELVYVEEAKWMKEIKSFCVSYKKKKGKEYYDEEMMVRGRLSKKKARTKARRDDLYVLLDVSGSMQYYSYKGIPLVQLFASYIPLFARKFEGHWAQSDGNVTIINDLKELKKDFSGKMKIGGGGGANYIQAVNDIIGHSMKHYSEKTPTIVLFSDMEEDFPNPMPSNFMLVTTSNKKSIIRDTIGDKSFPSEEKNQKIVLIDID